MKQRLFGVLLLSGIIAGAWAIYALVFRDTTTLTITINNPRVPLTVLLKSEQNISYLPLLDTAIDQTIGADAPSLCESLCRFEDLPPLKYTLTLTSPESETIVREIDLSTTIDAQISLDIAWKAQTTPLALSEDEVSRQQRQLQRAISRIDGVDGSFSGITVFTGSSFAVLPLSGQKLLFIDAQKQAIEVLPFSGNFLDIRPLSSSQWVAVSASGHAQIYDKISQKITIDPLYDDIFLTPDGSLFALVRASNASTRSLLGIQTTEDAIVYIASPRARKVVHTAVNIHSLKIPTGSGNIAFMTREGKLFSITLPR